MSFVARVPEQTGVKDITDEELSRSSTQAMIIAVKNNIAKTHDEIIYKIQNYAKLKIERNLLFSSLK